MGAGEYVLLAGVGFAFLTTLVWIAVQIAMVVLLARAGERPSVASIVAWAIQVLGSFTGPFVVVFNGIAALIALREVFRVRSGLSPEATRIPAYGVLVSSALMFAMIAVLVGAAFFSVQAAAAAGA